MAECPPARFDDAGRLLNADEAIGEIVNRGHVANFEGYYKNADGNAERVHHGGTGPAIWPTATATGSSTSPVVVTTGLRVDSENFALLPSSASWKRHPRSGRRRRLCRPRTRRSGDEVMAAVELRDGVSFDPDGFAAFLSGQSDLGTKWSPRYVRVNGLAPFDGTGKITKEPLRGLVAVRRPGLLGPRSGPRGATGHLTGDDRERLPPRVRPPRPLGPLPH